METVELGRILAMSVLLLWGVPILYFDLVKRRIPNLLTYSGIVLGGLFAVTLRRAEMADPLLAFLVGFGVFYVCYLFGWVGAGDVKLMAMAGICTGKAVLAETIFLSAVIGGFMALGKAMWLLFRGRPARGAMVPYGSAIVLGAYAAVFIRFGGLP
jgi:prepilin peptidase CpaA